MKSSKEFQNFDKNFCKEMDIEIENEAGILNSINYLKRIINKFVNMIFKNL